MQKQKNRLSVKTLHTGQPCQRQHCIRYGIMRRMIATMNYSKGDVVLLPYPFTDLKTAKVQQDDSTLMRYTSHGHKLPFDSAQGTRVG